MQTISSLDHLQKLAMVQLLQPASKRRVAGDLSSKKLCTERSLADLEWLILQQPPASSVAASVQRRMALSLCIPVHHIVKTGRERRCRLGLSSTR
jgi:hypothetical protein